DWIAHQDIMKEDIATLAQHGIKAARLAILPFEITQDGQNFEFTPVDTALTIMHEKGMTADLCLGPFVSLWWRTRSKDI
ncbi:MAG: hypothetical protein ACREGI_04940, partial [Candidatus Levyibacteriota bacterium]